jgi:hypothetical protein
MSLGITPSADFDSLSSWTSANAAKDAAQTRRLALAETYDRR